MNFNDIRFGDWIEIQDNKSDFTIEDFAYNTGVVSSQTRPHCDKCVAVNKCWFKNEKNKKPEHFPITQIQLIDNILSILPGLYHFRCHCEEIPIFNPSYSGIKLLIDYGKIQWLFLDKKNWIESMGYSANEDFIEMLKELIKKAYCNGKYELDGHTKYGVKINLFISISGFGNKVGKVYNIKSCFMVFPQGRLKCNTLIGGWQK